MLATSEPIYRLDPQSASDDSKGSPTVRHAELKLEIADPVIL
jgi:hypothetical protein